MKYDMTPEEARAMHAIDQRSHAAGRVLAEVEVDRRLIERAASARLKISEGSIDAHDTKARTWSVVEKNPLPRADAP